MFLPYHRFFCLLSCTLPILPKFQIRKSVFLSSHKIWCSLFFFILFFLLASEFVAATREALKSSIFWARVFSFLGKNCVLQVKGNYFLAVVCFGWNCDARSFGLYSIRIYWQVQSSSYELWFCPFFLYPIKFCIIHLKKKKFASYGYHVWVKNGLQFIDSWWRDMVGDPGCRTGLLC